MFVLFSIIGNDPERVIGNGTGQRPVKAGDEYFARLKALKRQDKATVLTGLSRITGLRFVGLHPTLMLKGRWPFGDIKRNVYIFKIFQILTTHLTGLPSVRLLRCYSQ